MYPLSLVQICKVQVIIRNNKLIINRNILKIIAMLYVLNILNLQVYDVTCKHQHVLSYIISMVINKW